MVDNGTPVGEGQHRIIRRRLEQGNSLWRERRSHLCLLAHGNARESRSVPWSNYGFRRVQPMDVSLFDPCLCVYSHPSNVVCQDTAPPLFDHRSGVYRTTFRSYRPWSDATDLYYTLVKQLGCDAWAKPLDCMLSKSTRTLLNVSDSYYGA